MATETAVSARDHLVIGQSSPTSNFEKSFRFRSGARRVGSSVARLSRRLRLDSGLSDSEPARWLSGHDSGHSIELNRRRSRAPAFMIVAIVSLVVAFTPNALAQTDPETIPANASAMQFGSGWTCDMGYRNDGNACVEINLPENAFLRDTRYGRGWECFHGFRASGDACVAVVAPDNAFLNYSGTSWECSRGFIARSGNCIQIDVPENGYLTERSGGRNWACERGYQRLGQTCTIIDLPEHAFLTDGDFGPPWKCERGFSKTGELCQRIDLPPNAHLDYSGNSWECSRPFRRVGDACVQATN